jgi:glycosyltransferase involved in cell wall biosynthesis
VNEVLRPRRLRVVTMVDSLMTSGAEIIATQIATELDPARFERIVCSTRPSAPEHVAAAEARGVEVLQLDRRSKADLWRFKPLVRRLRDGTDVLHAHKFGSNLWAALLSPIARPPVVIAHEHTWSFSGAPLRKLLDRRLIAAAADLVLAVSEEDREQLIRLEGLPPDKVRYVANGIPDPEPGDRARGREALRLDGETRVVGTVCALRPQKALEVAIDAVARTGDEGVVLVVVGDGPERARLEEHARKTLGARAVFAGRRPYDEITHLVAAMDVLVSSSSFEGMPLAVLEWMSAGKAIVATRVGGIPSLLGDGEEGLLVPAGDPDALAGALRRLLDDPTLGARLGAAARRRQQAEFRLDRTVETVQELYESLYDSARSRRT